MAEQTADREQPRGVEQLLRGLRGHDPQTREHTEHVARMACWVAEELGLDGARCEEVRRVALLHDVGKAAVPDEILRKPGPLSEAEWAVMRTHPEAGARMIRRDRELRPLAAGVRAHHERWDGSGYPDGLSGPAIPFVSRIVAVCDAFHAMISDRPYRRAMAPEKALDELEANAGTQLDPDVVDVVLRRFERRGALVH